MLEYFSYKKYKKYKEEKDAKEAEKKHGKPEPDANESVANKGDGTRDASYGSSSSELQLRNAVLKPEDERFLEELLAHDDDDDDDDDGPPPPLPPRIYTYDVDWHSDNEASGDDSKRTTDDEREQAGRAPEGVEKEGHSAKAAGRADKGKDGPEKKPNRLSLLFTRSKKPADGVKPSDALRPDTGSVTPNEAEREKKDLSHVLDRLNLSARNNKVVSQSKESSDLLQSFTQVFKDLVNGVPTAYDDLTRLMEDRDGSINKLFDKLPSSLKKLVTQLPEKLTGTLAPEILAAAAESQGIKAAEGGMKGTAKRLLSSKNLAELVKKPGAIVGMLKAIVEVLKTRWPAFIGMNVIWSVALSLLLVVLWYCYKRGREERLLREEAEAKAAGNGKPVQDLPDDAGTKNAEPREAAEAAEVVSVVVTPPEGEQMASATPNESCPKETSAAGVPRLDAPEEQSRP
ncbi:ring-like domain-containing [Trichoderma cornu-damae]|uniref:Ring-like domain-containing n=1 Tax=Trichoderma cornu-damae TaxID=654480 RepID=A0A9P8QLU4_9HYPO|nr:ring-like domain-containing [Trichoderma cornu-damae]